MSELHWDYPKVKISKNNPYYACKHCHISDPQINGKLENHLETCEYRIKKENLTPPTYYDIKDEEREKILGMLGWEIECESPYEIRHEDGSFATLNAAKELSVYLINDYLNNGRIE